MNEGQQKSAMGFGREADCRRFLSQDLEFLQQTTAAVAELGCVGGDSVNRCEVELLQLLERIQSCLSVTDDYQQALRSAHHCSPRSDRPWRFNSLIDTPQLRVGLLTLFRFAAIPLHDHPGSCGVQWLLSGKVRVCNYDLEPGDKNGRRLVSLNRAVANEYQDGETASFHQQSGNLHEISSISARSVLLSLMVRPYDERDRSWYFPVSPFSETPRGLFTRVNKPHRVNFS